jgi:hypothetical protein
MNTSTQLYRENDELTQRINRAITGFDKWCNERRNAETWTTLSMCQEKLRELLDENTGNKTQGNKPT